MITKLLIQELIGLFLCETDFRKYDLDTKKRAGESIFFPRSQYFLKRTLYNCEASANWQKLQFDST